MPKLNQPLINVNQVYYSYPDGTRALNNINLNIYKGEFVGIMGRNGAGKTTLVRMFNGLIRPTKGKIYYNGIEISTQSIAHLSKDIGVVFQNPQHQLFSTSVKSEIEFSIKNLGFNKDEANLKVSNFLNEFGLQKYASRSPLSLSGGEAKKLSLATILCRDPKVIVFDEPLLGQDAKEIRFFLNIIENLKKKNVTIILITHNVDFALSYIPRIVLLYRGQILADGPSHKVLSNKFLIEKSALIRPQIIKFKNALTKAGLNVPGEISSISDFKNLIVKQMQNK